jgi:hypothetical protein
MVGVQGRRVAVVVVDHRELEALGQRCPDVEAAPAGVAEVRRALGRDDAVPAGGAGRVQTHGPDRGDRHAGKVEHLVHGVDQRLNGLVRAFPDVAGELGQLVQEVAVAGIQDRPVVHGAAVVEAYDNPVDWHASSSSGRGATLSLWI